MASLHIAVGYREHGQSAEPHLIYLGRDADAMQRAVDRSDALRFELFKRVHGLRKVNVRAPSTSVAGDSAPTPPAPSIPPAAHPAPPAAAPLPAAPAPKRART